MTIEWFDGTLDVTVEAALSAATGTYGAWDDGVYDTATWGPDEQWTDVSQWVRAIRSDRKFSRETTAWDPGSASFLLSNRDGRFSPDNLDGPYVVAGTTAVRPWRLWRYKLGYAGTTWYVYTGYAVDYEETWAGGHADATVTVPCVDEMAALAEVDGLELSPAGAGETSGKRIHRILGNAGHSGARDIDDGLVTMQATTLAQNTVSELKLTVDSEGGGLWIDEAGTVVFADQYALMEDARSNTVQAVFSDGSDTNLPCADVTPKYSGDQIVNEVSFARVGGTAQVVVDATSRALYRTKRQTRTDLICQTDAQALALAQFYLEKYKHPGTRFSQIRIKPLADPERLIPAVLDLKVRDLVQVVAQPLGAGTVTRTCHITGVHHDLTPGDWVVTFDLWDASVYVNYSTSRWDIGRYNQAAYFFGAGG